MRVVVCVLACVCVWGCPGVSVVFVFVCGVVVCVGLCL